MVAEIDPDVLRLANAGPFCMWQRAPQQSDGRIVCTRMLAWDGDLGSTSLIEPGRRTTALCRIIDRYWCAEPLGARSAATGSTRMARLAGS